MATSCFHCSQYDSAKWSGVEMLGSDETPKEQKILTNFLRNYELKVDLGAGRQEVFKFDEANKMYLSRHFPSLDTNTYCCPPVFEPEYPGESTEIIEKRDAKSPVPFEKVNYDTLKRSRHGEVAEELVISKLMMMLKNHNVASFILHGYDWQAKYLKTILQRNKNLRKLFGKLQMKGGEIDLLISIPGKLLVTVEVKAAGDPSSFMPKVSEALSQCEKTVRFLSVVNFDLIGEKTVPLVKIAALPNIGRSAVDSSFCEECSMHVLTKEDFGSIASLHKWFEKLTTMYSKVIDNSQLDMGLHESLVGRLIGPASLVKARTIPESIQKTVSQITDQYGKAECIQERWYQFNPEQLSVKFRDPKFLWLTGEPGSGKTVLALWKVQEILDGAVGQNPHSRGSVLYVIAGVTAECLLQQFKERLGKIQHGTCEVIITTFKELRSTTEYKRKFGKRFQCEDLPHLMEYLQNRHPGRNIHLIMDEVSWFLSMVDLKEFGNAMEKCLDHERAGCIWIIQDTESASHDSSDVSLPRFHAFRLHYIMRLSKQNVQFTNILLGEAFQSGHAVSGLPPVIYRMGCLCLENQEQSCYFCHGVRVAWLLRRAVNDLQISRGAGTHGELSFEDFALLSENFRGIAELLKLFQPPVPFILQKYPDDGANEMTVCAVGDFQGCEQSVIIADVDTACNVGMSKECVTRTLGQLILLDGGCNPHTVSDYTKRMSRLEREVSLGNIGVETKVVELSDQEVTVLREMMITHLNNELSKVDRKIAEATEMKSSSLMDTNKERKEGILKRRNDLLQWSKTT